MLDHIGKIAGVEGVPVIHVTSVLQREEWLRQRP